MNPEILLTQEGYNKIKEEHEYLVSVRRAEVSSHLKEAKFYGDLSENAEYDDAKNEQAELEDRINKLENMMRNAKIVSDEEITEDRVNLGLTVKVQRMVGGKKKGKPQSFMIVGTTDADPFENKISNDSPIGKTLLGHRVGETVEVQTPREIIAYEIIEITKE